MTREEFIERYAKGSKVSREFLEEIGLIAVACDCGEDGCHGWRMAHVLSLTSEEIKQLSEEAREMLAFDA